MTKLFTDTDFEYDDYYRQSRRTTRARTVCFTAASAARRKKPTFPKKPPHGWGMTRHPAECDCQREKRLECESAEERRRAP